MMISAEPDMQRHEIIPGVDRFLILATDGLWDVLSNAKAATIACRCSTAQAAANQLCASALTYGTQDNVTALVVDLRGTFPVTTQV